MTRGPWKILGILSVTQIVSWGSLYYAFAILAPDIQRELGWSAASVFGAYSWSLLVAGLAATPAGILIDRIGGRAVMAVGSLSAGAGLWILANAWSLLPYFFGWTLLGAAMAMTLYEAAFATINRELPQDPRSAISTLTLFGGLASTVFWPLTQKLDAIAGWRDTLLLFAVIHLALCMPLHGLLPGGKRRAGVGYAATGSYALRDAIRHPAFWKLAFAFSANSFIFSAMSVHLIPLLQQFGHSAGRAVFLAALVGPMQVAGRIGEMTFARRVLPENVGKVTFSMLPAALLSLLLFGWNLWAITLFCALYGLSNGIMTIVRGTVPQTLFGRENYGAIAGALAGPALASKAAGPLAAAAVVQGSPSILALPAVLLAISVISLAFYLTAVKSARAELNSALTSA